MYGDLVSVIIPTYNRKNIIKRAIDSVLKQTYKNIELIIVDDCSTDGTMEEIQKYYNHIENLIYVINDTNQGAGKSRNIGAEYASGDYIAFQDSDDEWMPSKLEHQMRQISDAPEIGMVYCSYSFQTPDGRTLAYPSSELPLDALGENIYPFILVYPLIGTPTMLINKEKFIAVGGFNENLKSLEDYEFSVRFAYQYKIAYVNLPLVITHETSGGVNAQNIEKIITQCTILDIFYDELKYYGLLDLKLSSVHQRAKDFLCEKEFFHLLAQMEQEEYRQYAAGIEA